MADGKAADRSNQRYRTRKDLIAAAARLMKEGRKPSLEEVAEAALVSRATAYRYFRNAEALLVEASFDLAVPDGETLFAGDPSVDPEERVDKAEAAMHRMVIENEAALRLMLASAIARVAEGSADEAVPLRQNRRTPLIEAALAPARDRLTRSSYARLCAALAMIFGPESMIVFRDVLRLDDETAREVKSWAVRALVRAALDEPRSESGGGPRKARGPGGRRRTEDAAEPGPSAAVERRSGPGSAAPPGRSSPD
ncbi:TetR family transcriptional regulator [Benzoatithermus flavus]|uniref:TetR family transcriptional regulator n=1 Tax=Benzoatithermus flavus TaxID=3108223 RepID=A0ABU8XS39_9PROT